MPYPPSWRNNPVFSLRLITEIFNELLYKSDIFFCFLCFCAGYEALRNNPCLLFLILVLKKLKEAGWFMYILYPLCFF